MNPFQNDSISGTPNAAPPDHAPPPEPPDGRFIPCKALLAGSCTSGGLGVMVLVLQIPQIGIAVGSGLAAAGLIFTIITGGKDLH
ncbi:hypothetical protein [Actinomadura litoris]|uniref:Uncharacterized protein n=1 Tax=Actinomadura litoris TaxID=2678616 RepID=A0A7K1LBD7_9ACTN|nr:hypothetical protein [Actinomadura litoris]MUN41633.1 hypothetical protein [Actinomadura litoris]